jgi:hypothetical protein
MFMSFLKEIARKEAARAKAAGDNSVSTTKSGKTYGRTNYTATIERFNYDGNILLCNIKEGNKLIRDHTWLNKSAGKGRRSLRKLTVGTTVEFSGIFREYGQNKFGLEAVKSVKAI